MKEQARDYQLNGIEMIRQEFRTGWKKVLLWLATGAGKTFVFCRMVKDASSKGKKCIVVVRGRKLVDQASQRLTREGVHHGVLMANHWNFRPTLPVQVCSIDTLVARNIGPDSLQADLIIIDEAHLATSPGYRTFLSQYPKAFIVAVTATPYDLGDITHIADRVVHPIGMQELIDRGYLVPFRYFAPSEPDLSEVDVSKSTGDYVNGQLEGAMISGQLTGKIVEHWLKIAKNEPTLGFAVNVHHSKLMVEKFKEAGIAAEHCDAETPEDERNAVIARLESGETKVVWNVGIYGTGVDIPSLRAVILARPTKSKNLFIQQAGRGTRLAPGKDHCILLDHAGNIGRHGLPTDEEDVDLKGEEKKEASPRETKLCKVCFAMFRAAKCPECGADAPEAPKIAIQESDGELKELTGQDLDPVIRAHKQLLREARQKGRKAGWAHFKLIDRFGFDAARPHVPEWVQRNFLESERKLFAPSPFVGKQYK